MSQGISSLIYPGPRNVKKLPWNFLPLCSGAWWVNHVVLPVRDLGLLVNELTIDGLVQDCSNSSALAMELLQSFAKPSIWCFVKMFREFTGVIILFPNCENGGFMWSIPSIEWTQYFVLIISSHNNECSLVPQYLLWGFGRNFDCAIMAPHCLCIIIFVESCYIYCCLHISGAAFTNDYILPA